MDIEKNTWLIIGGLVVLIVAAGLVWLVLPKAPSTTATTVDTSTTSIPNDSGVHTPAPTVQTVASGEMISADDQSAGTSVTVASVTLTKPSWIAIKDIKGWVLGAAWVSQSSDAVRVPLLRATVAGQTYQAVIYVDNGDKSFDVHADSLVTASDAAPVSATFNVK